MKRIRNSLRPFTAPEGRCADSILIPTILLAQKIDLHEQPVRRVEQLRPGHLPLAGFEVIFIGRF